jgi:hypothetical protein
MVLRAIRTTGFARLVLISRADILRWARPGRVAQLRIGKGQRLTNPCCQDPPPVPPPLLAARQIRVAIQIVKS